jgi:branched-chain amino acid transport system ATP-binding protein
MSNLRVEGVSKRFAGLQALREVTFETEREILGLIGPNGAGKTTLFNIISGYLSPTEGKVFFGGRAIHNQRPHQVAALGIARTFQIVKPFGDLTVLENVVSGNGIDVYPEPAVFTRHYLNSDNVKAATELLGLTGLSAWMEVKASELPIGLQRRLEIARALATGPQFLLLDEPAAGLVSREAAELAALIRALHEQGKNMIVIEHNMSFAMSLCTRIIVLAQGEIIAQGTPEAVQKNEAVINAYLGRE